MGSIVDTIDVMIELGLGDGATAEELAVVEAVIPRVEGAIKRFIGYDPASGERTEQYPQGSYSAGSGVYEWAISGNRAVLQEMPDGSSDVLFLRHIPVRSIASLSVDYTSKAGTAVGAFPTEKTEGVDFWPNYDIIDTANDAKVCRDGMIRGTGAWPTTPGSVRVQYTAGYTAGEFRGTSAILDATPLWEAVIIETCRRVRDILSRKKSDTFGWQTGLLTSERLGDYSYSMAQPVVKTDGVVGGLSEVIKQMCEPFINWGYLTAG